MCCSACQAAVPLPCANCQPTACQWTCTIERPSFPSTGSVPSKAATPKAAPAKRKKAAVIESDSESDVAIGSSSDESVSDADDAGFIVDSSADDSPVKPSAKKKAKTGDAGVAKPASAAKGKAATPTAQATTGSKAATPIGAAKLTAAAAKKAARPQMVIEPSKPAVKHEVRLVNRVASDRSATASAQLRYVRK